MDIIIKEQGIFGKEVGEVVSVSKERAAHLVNLGFADYVNEDDKPKKKKVAPKKENAASKKKPEKAVK